MGKKAVVLVLLAWLIQGCGTAVMLTTASAATAVISDRRPAEVRTQDKAIYEQIKEPLSQSDLGKYINVDVYNGVVLLTGRVSQESLRSYLDRVALSIFGVRQVHNEVLVILPGTVINTPEADALLTTKIKAVLITQEGMEGIHTHITTNNGVVFLMGLVTREEAERVLNIVRRVEGVREAVPLFEYVRIIPANA